MMYQLLIEGCDNGGRFFTTAQVNCTSLQKAEALCRGMADAQGWEMVEVAEFRRLDVCVGASQAVVLSARSYFA